MYPISDPIKLQEIARQIRLDIVEMLYRAGSGHVGGSLSATDVLVALFFSHMHLDPGNACYPDRDFFVLSKGHAAPVLYAILARLGYFPREELLTLRQFGSNLQGHPDSKCTPGVEVPTGSLGQGLSVANGLALALKLNQSRQRVYALLGDGEIQEGQIWEAAMTASHYALDNLTALLGRQVGGLRLAHGGDRRPRHPGGPGGPQGLRGGQEPAQHHHRPDHQGQRGVHF
jgi:transketolase